MINLDTAYDQLIKDFFSSGSSKRYPKDQIVAYAADNLNNIYYIKSGYIKAYTVLDSGDIRTMFILGPGDIFPVSFSMSLEWDNYLVHYFYQTMSDAEFTYVEHKVLRKMLENNQAYLNTYLAYVSATNRAIMHQLEIMKNKNAIERVEQILPYLIAKVGEKIGPHTYQFRIKLSHQEIANLLGVTRETTTSLIKRLERKGAITQKNHTWIVRLNNSNEEQLLQLIAS